MVAQHSIVVGVDGSLSGLDAVAWAAQEASRRARPLHILHAFVWPAVYAPVTAPVPALFEEGIREAARQTVDAGAARARAVAPGVPCTTSIHVESAVSALLAAAEHASTVVVGNRGRGGFTGLLLGSVGVQLAAHAPCPLVIVRRGDRPPGPEAGRVVVGVDGSHDADGALRFAFEQASYRGIGLTAVLVYDAEALLDEQRRVLAEATGGWAAKYPDVDFRARVTHGRPAERLVERSGGAELLVVGSRGRGGFAGLLLGSVSQAVIHHAACPVAVVR